MFNRILGLLLLGISNTQGANLDDLSSDSKKFLMCSVTVQVNAYDTVHAVDALYNSKYFLTSPVGLHQDLDPPSMIKSLQRNENGPSISHSEGYDVVGSTSQREATMSNSHVHKVTILNLPEESVPSIETEKGNLHEGSLQLENNDSETCKLSSNELRVPILPWINGDGSINKIVYDGLVRRVLGIVMQNPGILEVHVSHFLIIRNPNSNLFVA